LGAFQGLALAFFIHAQHQRPRRRTHIQSHNVAHFLDEEWIGG
jgi:hypothetical protein